VALAVSAPAQNGKGSRKRAKTRAIKEVAHYLGNTPAVARSSYIDPRVFDRFDGGLTIAGVLPELGGEVEAWPNLHGEIEEGVLDLIDRDTQSDAIERARELAKELEEVAA
jgi:DNA topoisomerase I